MTLFCKSYFSLKYENLFRIILNFVPFFCHWRGEDGELGWVSSRIDFTRCFKFRKWSKKEKPQFWWHYLSTRNTTVKPNKLNVSDRIHAPNESTGSNTYKEQRIRNGIWKTIDNVAKCLRKKKKKNPERVEWALEKVFYVCVRVSEETKFQFQKNRHSHSVQTMNTLEQRLFEKEKKKRKRTNISRTQFAKKKTEWKRRETEIRNGEFWNQNGIYYVVSHGMCVWEKERLYSIFDVFQVAIDFYDIVHRINTRYLLYP